MKSWSRADLNAGGGGGGLRGAAGGRNEGRERGAEPGPAPAPPPGSAGKRLRTRTMLYLLHLTNTYYFIHLNSFATKLLTLHAVRAKHIQCTTDLIINLLYFFVWEWIAGLTFIMWTTNLYKRFVSSFFTILSMGQIKYLFFFVNSKFIL